MERNNLKESSSRSPSLPTIQYLTAADIMVCVGVGRSKAYEIIKMLNSELESKGFLTFPGKIPERKFREKLYLSSSVQLTAAPTGNTTKPKK